MVESVSATEARTHLGELMRKAVEDKSAIVVERSGEPYVVILAVDEYERLLAAQEPKKDWRALVSAAHTLIRKDLNGRPLPDPDDILREVREARDEQLLELR